MVKHTVRRNIKVKESIPEQIFAGFNYALLTLIALLMLYPIVNIAAVSFSTYMEFLKAPWMIFPRAFTLVAYELVFDNTYFWRSYGNSILITVCYTLLSLAVTALFSWPLDRKEVKGKPFLMGILIFTMVFSAGMIPNELLPFERGEGRDCVSTDMRECYLDQEGKSSWADDGIRTHFPAFNRYDAMLLSFAAMVRGEKENPWDYEYERRLHKLVLRACRAIP